jgi:hypothetical protein
LEDNLGEGGFGVVKRAKLLEPGKELFRLNNNCNIQLAAKIVRKLKYRPKKKLAPTFS